jgi:hypothetical protein
MQIMYAKGVSWQDESAVEDCAKELGKLLLPWAPKYKFNAAVHIRLGLMNELKRVYGLPDSVLALYGVLISRAIEMGDGIVGVIPMFDMINHSRKPNLGLHFNGKEFGLCALRDISHGEELFNSYSQADSSESWDENSAVWNLVQWGVPEELANAPAPQEVSS